MFFSLLLSQFFFGGGGVLIHWTDEYKEIQNLEILKSILANQLSSKSVFLCN